jgi:hypothetical protein
LSKAIRKVFHRLFKDPKKASDWPLDGLLEAFLKPLERPS